MLSFISPASLCHTIAGMPSTPLYPSLHARTSQCTGFRAGVIDDLDFGDGWGDIPRRLDDGDSSTTAAGLGLEHIEERSESACG